MDILNEFLFVTLRLVERLLYVVDQRLPFVLFYVQGLFELFLLMLELLEVVLGGLDGPGQVPFLASDLNEIPLEGVILGFEFLNLLVQEAHLLEGLILPMFEVLLVSVVADVFGEQLFHVLLLVKDDLVLIHKDLA